MNAELHRLHRLEAALGAAAAVEVAVELGLLDALAVEPQSAVDLARRHDLDGRAVALVLDLLQAAGVVVGRDGLFEAGIAPHRARLGVALWAGLRDRLVTGVPRMRADGADAARVYPGTVPLIAEAVRPAAVAVAQKLAADGMRVLDVGAGAAPWSLAMAERAAVHVTAVDLPDVLAVTRAAIERAGEQQRFELKSADALAEPLGDRCYDLVIAANLCHLFGDADNRRLFANARAALHRTGRIAVIDVLADAGARSAAYALGLMLRTRHGDVHTFTTYAAWLRDAGFTGIERVALPGGPPLSLITATR